MGGKWLLAHGSVRDLTSSLAEQSVDDLLTSSLGLRDGRVSLANLHDVILKRTRELQEEDAKAACEFRLATRVALSRPAASAQAKRSAHLSCGRTSPCATLPLSLCVSVSISPLSLQ